MDGIHCPQPAAPASLATHCRLLRQLKACASGVGFAKKLHPPCRIKVKVQRYLKKLQFSGVFLINFPD